MDIKQKTISNTSALLMSQIKDLHSTEAKIQWYNIIIESMENYLEIEQKNLQKEISDKQEIKKIVEQAIQREKNNQNISKLKDAENKDNTDGFDIEKDLISLNRWSGEYSFIDEYNWYKKIDDAREKEDWILYIELMNEAITKYSEWKKLALPRDIQNAEDIKEILIREHNIWNKDYPPPIPPPLTDEMVRGREFALIDILNYPWWIKEKKYYLIYQKDYPFLKKAVEEYSHVFDSLSEKYKKDTELFRIATAGIYKTWSQSFGTSKGHWDKTFAFDRI